MSIVNIGGTAVSQASYKKARSLVNDKKESGKRPTVNSMLESIRNMMPGWHVATSREGGAQEGFRNLEITTNVLKSMADCPEETVRFKALILDLEKVVQEIERKDAENPIPYDPNAPGSLSSQGKSSTGSVDSVFLEIIVGQNGNTSARATARTPDGVERSRTFDLSQNSIPAWAELIRKQLEEIRERNQAEGGTRSWIG